MNSRTIIDATLHRALQRQKTGELREAIRLYNDVLALDGKNFDAIQLLGLCCYQANQLAPALRYLNEALALRRDVASVFNHRGIVLKALERHAEALSDFDAAIALNTRFADAHFNKGNTLVALGQHQIAAASFEKASELQPRNTRYLNNLASCWSELNNLTRACEVFQRVVALDGADVRGLLNLGLILHKLQRFEEGISAYSRAIELDRSSAEAYAGRGDALRELRRLDEALSDCEEAIRLNDQSAPAYCSYANVLKELNSVEEALANYQKAISLAPQCSPAWIGIARIDSEAGRFEEAEVKYQRARSLDPKSVTPLCGIAEVKRFESSDTLVREFELLLSASFLSERERSELYHAYAKICNDLGRYDDAMVNFSLGKKLLKTKFGMKEFREGYAAMKRLFTREFFAQRSHFGISDERPVFVVGMPRSGTTLAEQILASHQRVDGLGELQDMPRIVEKWCGGLHEPENFANSVASLKPADVAMMAEEYLLAYDRSRADCTRVVDKRPHNYEWLGLIALMFPRAHIIRCRRDPLDNCVSMYMQNFSGSHGYNQDLATLGNYYREYADLMNLWSAALPVPIHDLVYEDVVSDLEGCSRSLVSFLGLDWDPNCLAYHQNARRVHTPSLWQVRQPLYDNSVGRWRRYEKHLGPLMEVLGRSDTSLAGRSLA